MFISHLTFIFSAVGFLLFIIKSYRQTDFERFLTLFSFLYFSLTGMWLYLNFYSNTNNYLFDLYGAVSENIALLVPVLIVYLFNRKTIYNSIYKYFALVLFIGVVFFGIQYFIASGSENKLIFDRSNKNLIYNVYIQLVYDFILFGVFLFGLRKIKSDLTTELFDGIYRKVFLILFIAYYCQDILYFLMVLVLMNNVNFEYGEYITLFLNLLISVLIITLALYTNWLFVLNKLKMGWEKGNVQEREKMPSVYSFDVKNGLREVKSWNDFKQVYSNEFKEIIIEVEKIDFLSKTEKLYAAFQPFDLTHKDIASLLSVSLRTVGTNFYRLRLKLKEKGYEEDFPYHKKKTSTN